MNPDPALIGLPSGVSAERAAAQFDQLQRKLVPLWELIESFNQQEQTIVVVPSMSVDVTVTGLEAQGYEERFLFLLLLLAQPRARMIYVTSQAIHPSVIEYYLDLLSGVIPSHAMRRLTLLSPYDAQRPSMKQAIVKLNEGVSGEGNATVDLSNLDKSGDAAIFDRVRAMRFELGKVSFDEYAARFRARGGIVEERVGIGTKEVRSPSVQLRITPLGKVELLSTHDQMLGGPSGQSYLGCIFPADPAYATAITHDAAKVGDLLRDAGVIGRFALDFVVTRAQDTASWQTYAIEINLRKGGTTHPFLTLQFLTGGHYNPESATFIAPNGHKKFLVASDHLESPRYRGFTPDDLFDLAVRRGLHFGQVRQTGVVFHMLSALGSAGRLGLTAVGNSPEEAQSIFGEAKSVLDEEARFNEL